MNVRAESLRVQNEVVRLRDHGIDPHDVAELRRAWTVDQSED